MVRRILVRRIFGRRIFGRQILGPQIFVPPSTMASGIRSVTTPLRPHTSFLPSTEEVMAGEAVGVAAAGVGVEEQASAGARDCGASASDIPTGARTGDPSP